MRRKMIEFLVWVIGKLSKKCLVAVADGKETWFMGKGYAMGLHILSIAQVICVAVQMENTKLAITDAAKILEKLAPEYDKKGDGGNED